MQNQCPALLMKADRNDQAYASYALPFPQVAPGIEHAALTMHCRILLALIISPVCRAREYDLHRPPSVIDYFVQLFHLTENGYLQQKKTIRVKTCS